MDLPPLKIVSVGECTIDRYVDRQIQFVGGISLNFAVNAKRCGADQVSLITRVGTDYDSQILQRIVREKIDTSHISIAAGSTACQNIVLTQQGERIFPKGGYQPGVLEDYTLNYEELRFVREHNVIFSALFKQVEGLFYQLIQETPFGGWFVADFLDLSDYDQEIHIVESHIEKVNVAFISGNREMVERFRPVSRSSNCLIVITLGAEGSIALTHGEAVHQPAISVAEIVDSTGCGDAFQAAFTASYWRDRDLQVALKRGAEQAAQVIQHLGATR